MHVLHINQSDISGGAAIAGYRLHQGLLDQGIDSKILAGNVKTENARIERVSRKPKIENLLHRITWHSGLNYINLLSSFSIPNHKFYQEADVLNFHNLHSGYFNYLAISKLTKAKPAVFTLHDMWSFTGHCAHSCDCVRWKTGCGNCPYPDTYPEIMHDSTRLEWKLKNWIYSKSNLRIITLSHWLTEQAKASMLRRFPIHHIPNGVDIIAYQPIDRLLCRAVLDIPRDKKVILFGATNLKNKGKGGDLLTIALRQLPNSLKRETILMTFGSESTTTASGAGMQVINLGYISSDRLKSIAYSAADLFVLPTRADTLPLVLQESMACGTPMVSFDVGGVPDLVRPMVTGYLAKPEDARDLCKGITTLLEDMQFRQDLSVKCRAIAVAEYSLDLQAKRYIALYKQIVPF